MTTTKKIARSHFPEAWVDEYGDALYSYAVFRMEDKGVAEELVQETFMAALSSFERFQGKSSLKTWLFSILKNKISDHLRVKYKELTSNSEKIEETSLDNFFDSRGEWLVYPGDWGEMPQEKFEQQEFIAVLEDCLTRLPPKQGEAFKMRELDEDESKEICKVLGVSATNYWVLIHRARLLMRKCIEQNWFTTRY